MSHERVISHYDPNKQLQFTLFVCEDGAVTGFEVIFDNPQSLVDFRPERVFMPYGVMVPPPVSQPYSASVSDRTSTPIAGRAPCNGCGGKR